MHENGSEMKSPVEFEQMLKKIWRKQHRVQMEEEGKEGSEGLKVNPDSFSLWQMNQAHEEST